MHEWIEFIGGPIDGAEHQDGGSNGATIVTDDGRKYRYERDDDVMRYVGEVVEETDDS